jgi:CheY-like chemotaxis protein
MKLMASSRVKGASILLVDDNRNGTLARVRLLEEQGHRTTTASNGEEGWQAFSSDKFDLVITDYRMPRMNGQELIQKIREVRPDTRIILLSGYTEGLGLDEESTGADTVIAKGANEVAHLLRAVSRLLQRGVQRKPLARQKALLKARAKGV